jgi:PiT family inorganic phosphate transporter
VQKAGIGIVASPAIAFGIAFLAMYLIFAIQRLFKLRDDAGVFKGLQLVSAAAVSFGHGANDAQKTMGVIAALLLGAGYTQATEAGPIVPTWAALAAYAAIALGTLWGGWRIIETMGLRITLLHASSGAAANIGATTSIFGATALGVPVSTTHAAASSIVGAGVASGRGANWKVVGEMVVAWVLTIPAAGLVGFAMLKLTQLPTVAAWISIGAVLAVFGAWAVWAMLHSKGAKEVEAEIPSEATLSEPGPHRPHVAGKGAID